MTGKEVEDQARKRRHQGMRTAVRTAAAAPTPAVAKRLADGPMRSAIHPRPVIPTIAATSTPLLNTLNTRAIMCFGVRS